jgi:flagellar protein FlaF
MTNSAANAYFQAQKSAATPRSAEAIAFTQAAVALDQAKTLTHDYDAYSDALKSNQKLWTVVQVDLLEDGNRLSNDLKQNLLDLSAFVDKQTLKALVDPQAEHLDAPIEINRNIAGGLRE